MWYDDIVAEARLTQRQRRDALADARNARAALGAFAALKGLLSRIWRKLSSGFGGRQQPA